MGIRGELYTTDVVLENRTYFFNVKENRAGDIFLQIVESKKEKSAKKAAKSEKYGLKSDKLIYRKKGAEPKRGDDGIKRTGKVIHIKSKIEDSTDSE